MPIRREFTAAAVPVKRWVQNRRTSGADPRQTVQLRINDHRRRLTPEEAERLGRELIAAAAAGRDIEAASWTL